MSRAPRGFDLFIQFIIYWFQSPYGYQQKLVFKQVHKSAFELFRALKVRLITFTVEFTSISFFRTLSALCFKSTLSAHEPTMIIINEINLIKNYSQQK